MDEPHAPPAPDNSPIVFGGRAPPRAARNRNESPAPGRHGAPVHCAFVLPPRPLLSQTHTRPSSSEERRGMRRCTQTTGTALLKSSSRSDFASVCGRTRRGRSHVSHAPALTPPFSDTFAWLLGRGRGAAGERRSARDRGRSAQHVTGGVRPIGQYRRGAVKQTPAAPRRIGTRSPSPRCVSTGDITQKGYEKKRGKLLAPYIPQIQGVDPSLQVDSRAQSAPAAPAASKQHKARAANSRDERFRSDIHTEAVQAALAKYKERKMPMPSKRRSVLVQSSVEACTPQRRAGGVFGRTELASRNEERRAAQVDMAAGEVRSQYTRRRRAPYRRAASASSSEGSGRAGARAERRTAPRLSPLSASEPRPVSDLFPPPPARP
ncbi:hypothetical protein ANANG_G00280600 [Anguilla anguilla]|uniref:DMAP1-binding domain-containing protein n=1 Tax=Anguilla anguilla TaxID=7936 RepID=A0A9D3LNI1_ANGAN|nr:hypothetical protein ANANG_G00280600 [Anguilla anguilla]